MINHSYLDTLLNSHLFDNPSIGNSTEKITVNSKSLLLEVTIMSVSDDVVDGKTQFVDFWLKEYNSIVANYLKYDDQLAVVMSVALLEKFFKKYISLLFIDYSNNSDLTNFIDNMSFANIGKYCFLSGILSDKDFNDLSKIIKIRNNFAHHYKDISFDSKKIVELVQQIKLKTDEQKSIKEYFLLRIGTIIAQCVTIVQRREWPIVTPPNHEDHVSRSE